MKKILPLLLIPVLFAPTAGCSLLQPVEPLVVTTTDNVEPGTPAESQFLVPIEWLSPSVKEQLEEHDKELVIIPKSAVLSEDAPAIEIKKPETKEEKVDAALGIAELGVDILKVFFPALGVLEGIGFILSQRKRQHYMAAFKAITPYDGNVDVKEAVVSLTRALGFAHTEKEPTEGKAVEEKGKQTRLDEGTET